MTASFNVLNRKEVIHRHMLLEASAGTGKTFAIENIVVRLLIELKEDQEPLLIENILVMTFTRMAARELRERIRSNLEKILRLFERYLSGEDILEQFSDYLLAYVEKGNEAVLSAIKSIERALFSFDRAQIFTIHGFCWRMLKNYAVEAGVSLDSGCQEDGSLSTLKLLQVVRDFLRRELVPSMYSPQQLKIIMKSVKNDFEKLQQDLLYQVNRGIPIKSPPSFYEYFLIFQEKMSYLKREFNFEAQKIKEDFLTLAPFYKELRNIKKEIHPEKMAKMERFVSLFNKEEWKVEDLDILIEDGVFLLEAFNPHMLMAKAKALPFEALHYPHLLKHLREYLEPLVAEARNSAFLFLRLASDCQKFIWRYQKQEEVFGHHELLVQMRKAIEKPGFLKRIRSLYLAAIVDEFQDTDPLQWEIFSLLFIPQNQEWKGYLNLVGDPKQSIYAFRQADIYTYLSAAEKLGKDSVFTLETNFRSRFSLIEALNLLFESALEMFSLPKIKCALPYRRVKAGRKDFSTSNEVLLHFWKVLDEHQVKSPLNAIEANFLLPAIAKEILRLNENGVCFGQCAILIADRYQANRVNDYLKKLNIPVKSQKGKDLNHSSVVEEMRDLLEGVLHYPLRSRLNVALASRVVGMTHHELLALEQEGRIFDYIQKFHVLRNLFLEFGFSPFYNEFMESSWHSDGKSVLERLLNQTGGFEFYREWQDLADLMIAEEHAQNLLPEGILEFLDDLEGLSKNEDDRVKAYMGFDEEGVSVLTTHVSKGLEFDYVFALAFIKRNKLSEDVLIPFHDETGQTLIAVENSQDPRYQKFCEENDAEKMRQLYVGLTRAKEKLYVPIVINNSFNPIPIGCASPIELLLGRLDKEKTDYEGLYQRLAMEDGSNLANFVIRFPDLMALSIITKQQDLLPTRKSEQHFELIPPKQVEIPGSHKVLQSFTSLMQFKHAERSFLDEDLIAPHDFLVQEKTVHNLPSGNETGIILHKIFEKISFDAVRKIKNYRVLKALISPFLHGTSFVLWEDVIAELVFKVLKTHLPNHHFSLAEIDSKKMYRETEFFYPCDGNQKVGEMCAIKPGFLKGVVDLFFEYQGKFYLVDWKSNWLGPSDDYYGAKHLTKAMKANAYDLQAAIYCEAFHRYLKIFDHRPFKEIFGGIYYVFLRGVGTTTGVFYDGDCSQTFC